MRSYSKVSPTFWTSRQGKMIVSARQGIALVAMYLKTCASANVLGLYYLPVSLLSHEVQMSREEVLAALNFLASPDVGYCLYDRETEYVWVLDMAKEQIGENLGARRQAQREFEAMSPDCLFRGDFMAHYGGLCGLGGEKAPHQVIFLAPDDVRHGHKNDVRMSNTDTEKMSGVRPDVRPGQTSHGDGDGDGENYSREDVGHGQGRTSAWPSPRALMDLYNASVPEGHPRVKMLDESRGRKARRYLSQFPDRTFWVEAFSEIGLSAFLQHGSKDSPNFRGDLDWCLQVGKDGTANVVKLHEGKYRDGRGFGPVTESTWAPESLDRGRSL